MDNRQKVKLKSCKKQLRRDQGPLLKPDVMLITKDVMVPIKVPSPPGRCFPNSLKTKLRIENEQKLESPRSKATFGSQDPDQSYIKDSLPQAKEITPEERIGKETVPKSPFSFIIGANNAQKNVCPEEKEAASLEKEHLSLRQSSGLFKLNIKDSRNIESAIKIPEVDETLTPSSKNSMSSLATSLETRSCSSTKSIDVIEDSLPKLPFSIISSSESESTIRAPVIPSKYLPEISTECNNRIKNFESENTYKFYTLNSQNNKSSSKNIDKEFTESDLPAHQNSSTKEESCALNNVNANAFEDNRIMIDVEYLLQSLLTNLETVEDSNSFDDCGKNFNVEEQSLQTFNKTDDNFRCSSRNLDETLLNLDDFNSTYNEQSIVEPGRRYSWQEINPNDEQLKVKYSWQIITAENEGLNDADKKDSINYENNSKLTSTEDLCLNKLKVQYSWQKLTSKYLPEKPPEDDKLPNRNQPVLNVNDFPKKTSNAECLTDYSSFEGSCLHHSSLNTNSKKNEKLQITDDTVKVAVNSPLNNIISSMLPEMKLFNRRSSFNNTTPEIVDNYKDNYLASHARIDSNKSSASYSSVSSIKHVIANLTEMVTTQKHMLDAYIKDHELDGYNITKPLVNPVADTVERVEIFPSTLHVLGNYIVRDIRPTDMNDQRNLLDSNNDETIQDRLLSNDSVHLQTTKLDKHTENILNDKISATIATNESCSQSPTNFKDADLSSLLNSPTSYDLDYYSRIFAAYDEPSPKKNNQSKCKPRSSTYKETRDSSLLPIPGYHRRLTEKNWEQAIAEMEETIELSQDARRCIEEGNDDGNEDTPYTQSTGPLIPRVKVTLSETKDAVGDSKTRKDELITRLEGAMSRLKQSEEHLDANWNLDYSVLDIEESIEDKEVQLPKEVEEHIKDIVKSAEEYLAKLEEQLNDLRNADDQIINSSERTFKDIDESYQLFMDNLCQEINKRRNLVRLETEVFKYEGLAPLRACRQEVDAQIRSTQHLIVLTENMLSHPVTFNKERLGKIINATSHMGRIPAVPMPEELPYVTFSPPSEEMKKEITDRISCLGCVMRMGPAQFTEVLERPACLQLKWNVVDPEYASEEQTFIVQKALGEITEPNSSAFETVYVGPEMSCFVRDLPVDHQVTLRVGIQVTDTAWSVHRIAQTSIPAYSWDMENSDYLITNSGRIATKITQNLSTLLSRSAQFSANYIIEFKFLEAASGTDDEGIGLVFEPGGANETLKRNGALLITPNGNIFVNGEQKLMQLPKIVLGTRIIFTSEPKDDETLRMTVECANKGVTYDWTVQRPLHFAARFSEHNKWNVMVK